MSRADANKRIDLAARRHGGAEAGTALPSYKPGEISGPMGHVGVVPFRWEQRPGHPKSVRTRRAPPPPPATTAIASKEATSPARKPAEMEERWSTDARSRDDVSCVTVNCSATGLSDAPAAPPGSRGSGAMMDRFLPAAHAVAVASPVTTFRKAGSVREPARPAARAVDRDRLPVMQRRLPLQDVPTTTNHLQLVPLRDKNEEYDDDDDAESDVNSTRGFASRKCGLLPTRCVKSTLLLLNPRPAMRCSRSRGSRRVEDRSPLVPDGGRSQQREANPMLRRSRSGRQRHQLRQTGGHDPGCAVPHHTLTCAIQCRVADQTAHVFLV